MDYNLFSEVKLIYKIENTEFSILSNTENHHIKFIFTDDFLIKISKLIPLGRMAKVNEYQGAIIFLISNASSYMNGAIIPIDGGRSSW